MSSNKVILITGANTGLGLEIVKALYKTDQSYQLIVGCRTVGKGEAAVESVKKEIPQSVSSLSVVQVDLASDESINNALKTIESKFGRLDVLINNGGAGFDREITSGKMSIREAWNASWDTNVAGTQVLTTAAIPLLLKSSDPRLMFVTSGTSSIAETEILSNPISQRINGSPEAGWPKPIQVNPIESYRSSKAGLNMMMRQWHRILLNDGVKVWCISPGFLATGLAGIGPEQLLKVSKD
jgi:NAD(P)-dependent dehydrogenase (short-subunit alcohol dehydrogenase family)